jgi:hypothetical protein
VKNLSVVVVALGLVCAGPLQAQQKPSLGADRNARQGFWIGFGVGAGSVGADCSGCSNDRTGGFSGYLRMGGTLSRHLLLGGEANGWSHSENGADESMGFGSLVLLWYPSATGAFYLKFGIGGMTYTADIPSIGKIEATAGSGSFGLGYEFRVRPNMSLNLFLNSLASAPASWKLSGVSVPTGQDIKLNLVQLGVGLTWH